MKYLVLLSFLLAAVVSTGPAPTRHDPACVADGGTGHPPIPPTA